MQRELLTADDVSHSMLVALRELREHVEAEQAALARR
jgi:hypothetical protein